MAAQYFGVGGVAKKVKGQYFGASGAARKVKAGYIGVDNVARKFYAGLDIKPTLADNDWATIAVVSEMGAASTYWSVGDEKDITLSDGETLTLVIVGFDHDDLVSGGKAGITFGLKNLMTNTGCMNATTTNSGGWAGSEMYTWLHDAILQSLPNKLKDTIKDVNKKTSKGLGSSEISTDTMKIFLFSGIEIRGSTTYSAQGEGAQYSYFLTADNRIKKLQNGAGDVSRWWLRSPDASSANKFCGISKTGMEDRNFAYGEMGVCFGFCV